VAQYRARATPVVPQRAVLLCRIGYDQPTALRETVFGPRQSNRADSGEVVCERISSYWVREASPFLSVLPGDLQTVFIEPQVRELAALGSTFAMVAR
jgi:hypothetical protein